MLKTEDLKSNIIITLFDSIQDDIEDAKDLINFSDNETLTLRQSEELFNTLLGCYMNFSHAMFLLDNNINGIIED